MTAPARTEDFQTRPTHDALELTQQGKNAHIVLNDMVYTLTITRAGKLILTK
ncbi:hemin uptake protein HemP [Aliiroseovarius sp.]|uniref:hemin uptake protein HemP n=1 Tax=Aliiroseovarius sp. TaxID=1872442 RepID=UPI003BAB172E